jgi:hypothetical protein
MPACGFVFSHLVREVRLFISPSKKYFKEFAASPGHYFIDIEGGFAYPCRASSMTTRYWTPLHVVDKSNADTFKFEGISRPPAGWTVPK